jgi:hypothetical protein
MFANELLCRLKQSQLCNDFIFPIPSGNLVPGRIKWDKLGKSNVSDGMVQIDEFGISSVSKCFSLRI